MVLPVNKLTRKEKIQPFNFQNVCLGKKALCDVPAVTGTAAQLATRLLAFDIFF